MFRFSSLLASTIAVALTGCGADDITGGSTPEHDRPTPIQAAAQPAAAAAPDVSGSWIWQSVEDVSFPPFIAGLLGLVPEGDLTHGRCESAGTMLLSQTGASFEGTAQKLFNACMTEGGQPFNQPGTQFQIDDGRATGASLRFSFETATVKPCPHHVHATVEGGIATALEGNGRCFLPGHPRSESPIAFDPPPQGRSRTVSWTAVRP